MPRRDAVILDPALEENILALVRTGVPLGVAAAAVGLTPTTIQRWVARGSELAQLDRPLTRDEAALCLFAAGYHRARGAAVADRVGRIRAAGMGRPARPAVYDEEGNLVQSEVPERPPQWAADAWWLERQMPEEFGRGGRVDVPVVRQGADVDDERLRALAAAAGVPLLEGGDGAAPAAEGVVAWADDDDAGADDGG